MKTLLFFPLFRLLAFTLLLSSVLAVEEATPSPAAPGAGAVTRVA